MSGQSDRSHEERIRLKAYEIWLNEGKPEGRDARHWEMAREAIGYDDARRSTLKPTTPAPGAVETATFKSKPGPVASKAASKPAAAAKPAAAKPAAAKPAAAKPTVAKAAPAKSPAAKVTPAKAAPAKPALNPGLGKPKAAE